MCVQVHVLFSTLGVTVAYVTNMGKLVGIITMKEVRVQRVNSSMSRVLMCSKGARGSPSFK